MYSEKSDVILDTGAGLKNGQQFCPNCGASQIYFDSTVGKLVCPYCETIFNGEKIEETKTATLQGTIIGSGARKINENFNNIVTLRCNGCGANITIDTSQTTQARCHWCRGILSINERIENGAVPDKILPFIVTKEEAKREIDNFIKKRKFFTLPVFKKEYKSENIMGVYLPYMLVDANVSCDFEGEGEHQTEIYWVNDGKESRYNANLYKIKRLFNLTIEDLSIETSKDKLDKKSKDKTNNIINAIMPFDTENCVRFESRYLTGFTSEKRDINIEDLKENIEIQIRDIARHSINNELTNYDRGIKWKKEHVDIIGTRWITSYLPVWIYSYYDKNRKQIHYIAVNGRTKELKGSIPVNFVRLFIITGIIEIFALYLYICITSFIDLDEYNLYIGFLLLTTGIIFYKVIKRKYRNIDARHAFEKETKTSVTVFIKEDTFIKEKRGMKNDKMEGHNNTRIEAENIERKNDYINKMVDRFSNKR